MRTRAVSWGKLGGVVLIRALQDANLITVELLAVHSLGELTQHINIGASRAHQIEEYLKYYEGLTLRPLCQGITERVNMLFGSSATYAEIRDYLKDDSSHHTEWLANLHQLA